jgi:O-antigen ligase/polysaccharide polymerase Wzy-like membrane protein
MSGSSEDRYLDGPLRRSWPVVFAPTFGFVLSTLAQSYSAQASAGDSRSADFLVFTIPFLQFVKLNVTGVLYGSELLLMATFLYFAFNRKLQLSTSICKKFLVLCSAWLVSQIVTDFVEHTAFADYARGWSRIVITLVAFSVLYTLMHGRQQRLVLYGWGLVVGGTLELLIDPGQWGNEYPWKFGMSFPVTLGVFLLASRKDCGDYWPIILSGMIGCVNVAAGTRSRGGMCFAVALYLLVSLPWRRKCTEISAVRAKSVVLIGLALALGLVVILWGYQYAAGSGLLGYGAQDEYETQATGEYGVLLGGRSAILGSIPAIYDSPILGHGSWARDPIYVLAQLQAMAALGYENTAAVEQEELEEGYVPAHSYLFGAWVEAGIVGAIFWLWVLILALKALLRVYPSSAVLLPLAAFSAISLAWDVLFSPYGAQQRIIVPYCLVLLMTQLGMNVAQCDVGRNRHGGLVS